MYYEESNGKKVLIISAIVVLVLSVIITAFYLIYTKYKVTIVNVTGNQHYTAEQIKDIVMEGPLGDNSLYLSLKYRNKDMKGIPFVETMDVDIVSPNEIYITVYEKAIAGYVNYLDRYMYFDKDGIVVESSTSQIMDLPYVTGLSFDHCVLYEKLPVENEEIFSDILLVTQLLEKYKLSVDRIDFDSNLNLTLYKGDAKITMGSFTDIDEKMIKLASIMPELEGLNGVLDMSDYSEETDSGFITFKRN